MTKVEIDTLKKALFILGREEVQAYKALPDEDVVFSKEFEDKVRAINKRRRSLFYRATKTVPRRIAVVLIAAVITFTMMMSVSAIRTPILNFVIKTYDSFISIFAEKDEEIKLPTSIEHMYLPAYFPEGYIEISSENSGFKSTTIWMNDSSMMILLQDIISEDTKITIDNQELDYKTISVNKHNIHYYVKDGYYFVIWSDGHYIFTLTCPEDINISEIEKIIASME